MAHYPDLSPYNYHHYSEKELNIGWLDKSRAWPVGEISKEGFERELSDEFIKKLKVFIDNPFPMFCAGSHQCQFCDDKDAKSSCEIRVIGKDGKVYAAPHLILHYIEKHRYLPPQEFVDAVLNGPAHDTDEYKNILSRIPESWERRRPDTNDENYEEKMRALMIDRLSEEVDQQLVKDIIQQNPNFQKFVEAYNKIMPAVYTVNIEDVKKNKKS